MAQQLARVAFRRSGGFAGNLPALSVDLVGTDAAPVEGLVDLEALRTAPSAERGTPDAFRYELRVETVGGERYELVCGEADLPASLRPLVQRLAQLAQGRS